jgi:hypothetical protein
VIVPGDRISDVPDLPIVTSDHHTELLLRRGIRATAAISTMLMLWESFEGGGLTGKLRPVTKDGVNIPLPTGN